ncbi:MAG: hypothetical protein Q9191_003665 [Dirinaria sp. TL-2023a]
MSSTNPAPSPDTPITIKIALNNGENRRFKLALRELGANTLPDQLRSMLAVPPNQNVIFERFSDSAGAYIKLDSNNPSVYKQLYRAAKAKLKLRIRATISTNPLPVPNAAPPAAAVPDHLTGQPYTPSVGPNHFSVDAIQTLNTLAGFSQPSQPIKSLNVTGNEEQQRPAYTYSPPTSGEDLESYSTDAALKKLLVATEKLNVKKDAIEPDLKKPYALNKAEVKDGAKEALVDLFPARDQFYAELASMSSKDSRKNMFSSTALPFNAPGTSFTICCNICNDAIPNSHYHCSICDDGDFDICEACYNQQIHCDNDDHWLVKRYVKDGKVASSLTETVPPKKSTTDEPKEIPGAFTTETKEPVCDFMETSRTCNSCVGVFDESSFVTCTVCEDYDLCVSCHMGLKHGHHPNHAFMPASEETKLSALASKLLAPGRDIRHSAICDGCDKDIHGVRHKCLNCPDWDFCSGCVKTASTSHPGHRFVPLYEPIACPTTRPQRHYGIHCDGPLCIGKGSQTYISGDRYKCAVCHDTDFCANCEALPTSRHNRTHPLIKFKTPVKNVSVTTLGEKENGEHSYTVGDQLPHTSSKSTETTPAAPSANAATQVQAVVEAELTAPMSPAKAEIKKAEASPRTSELQAHFLRDLVVDGSILPPGAQFEQVWTLRNPGPHPWPTGCSVRFVGGDSMFDVDPSQPSHQREIEKASESNVHDRVVEVGEEVDFKIAMRTPEREGKAISYWRLKDQDGFPFGHKLWCDITVCAPEKPVAAAAEPAVPSESHMIFPKLDKESPVSSTHEAANGTAIQTEAASNAAEDELVGEVENLDLDDSETDDGFLTDEEYEMLSASEDEFKEARNGKK